MNINVAVFFGGRSVEHEISIISAVQAMGNISKEKYNVLPVYMDKSGEFYYDPSFCDIEVFKTSGKAQKVGRRIAVTTKDGRGCLEFLDGTFRKKAILFDVAFPIVHGTNCEDGSLQGLFESFGIPYVGCDVMSSALGMDKSLFKNVLQANGIPVLSGLVFGSKEWSLNRDSVIEKAESEIGYPLIVKPTNLGSSIGISKVDDRTELVAALDLAFSFADRVLIEHAVTALREINCSVLGDKNECEASELEEPVMHDKILSYDDKYKANASKSGSKGMASLSRKLPADLTPDKANEIKQIAIDTFKCIGAAGVVRIDFLIDTANNDKVYVNEINTIPGSLSFYLWEAAGVKYPKLLDRLISLAFKRRRERENLMFTIDTNILNESSFGAKGSKGKI